MEDRLIRLSEIIGKKKNGEVIEKGLLSIGASTWWKGVKEGRFPAPVKLGERTTCWRLSDVLEIVQKGAEHGN